MIFREILDWAPIFYSQKKSYIARLLVKTKSIPDWHLFITQMDILFTKKELHCALASKNKINTRLAFVYYSNGNEMDQMVRNDIAYRSLKLLFGKHTFHSNCFFEDFNYAAYLNKLLNKCMISQYQP